MQVAHFVHVAYSECVGSTLRHPPHHDPGWFPHCRMGSRQVGVGGSYFTRGQAAKEWQVQYLCVGIPFMYSVPWTAVVLHRPTCGRGPRHGETETVPSSVQTIARCYHTVLLSHTVQAFTQCCPHTTVLSHSAAITQCCLVFL
jgi:hypothetical protein